MGDVENEADESALGRYTDGGQIADYARQAVAYFTETGALTKDALYPEMIADRANAAEFIANVILASN